ncbi:MAG: DMT family transporter [Clostridium sp.]
MVYALFLSFIAGVSIVVARIINANLGDKIGVLSSTFFNYVTGLFFSFIILLFTSEMALIPGLSLSKVPLIGYLGGIVGVIVVSLSSYVAPRISAFYMTLFCFIGQLFVGIIIDYINFGTLSFGKILGGFLVLAGLIFNLNLDKKSSTEQIHLEETTLTN